MGRLMLSAVAIALLAGCCGLHRRAETEGPSVLDVLPLVDRSGDVYGAGARYPLELTREVVGGRISWTGRYVEQVGREKAHVMRTVRIGSDGKESVSSSEDLSALEFPRMYGGELRRYLRLVGRDAAEVCRVDFNPDDVKGVLWCGEEKVEITDRLLQGLSLKAFQKLISTADKVVIRDGGGTCCGAKIDSQRILFEMTDATEIAAFNALFSFDMPDGEFGCMCCGYPGVDWWKDGERIVISSVHHGSNLRWKDFHGDMPFTPESAKALAGWFDAHGLLGSWKKQ